MSAFKKLKSYLFLFILLYLFSISAIWARAGGGGGGGGHSGGSHSSSFGGSYGGSHSGTGYNSGGGSSLSSILIFVGIFILLAYFQSKQKLNKSSSDNERDSTPDIGNSGRSRSPLDPELFQKISYAFINIQKSWSEKDLPYMRRFITDGVYQRFNAQFTMMNLLNQANVISNIRILNISKIQSRNDGNYEVIDVRINAYAEDQFVSPKYPNLNSPGNAEEFVEYWSFIRRLDYKVGSDIYHSELCPKCAAPLQGKLIESAQCPHCQTYLNNGEYDWVLAEIVQEENYQEDQLVSIPAKVTESIPDFTQKLIEDKASNAFMQILIATAERNEAPLARFSSSEAFFKFKKVMRVTNVLYDRLFLNSVTIKDISVKENICFINIDIVFSCRRVRLKNDEAFLLDGDIRENNTVLTFMRELGGAKTSGSIYANSCSHCGAAQKDSLASTCAYCNQPLNDPKTEWVVDQLELMN